MIGANQCFAVKNDMKSTKLSDTLNAIQTKSSSNVGQICDKKI